MSKKKGEANEATQRTEVETVSGTSNEQPAAASEAKAEQEPPVVPGESNDGRAGSDNGQVAYPPEPNPRQWAHNNVAGVQYFTRREPYQAELVFQDKPSQAVIDYLKSNGFKWNRHEKAWTRPINFDTQNQDRLIASRTYHKAVEMIYEEKGLAPEPEQEQSF